MNYLRQVQSGIDYIEFQLESDTTPVDVALYAGISRRHFQRIFKALTNETLKSYIRARRLANSLHLLLNTDLRIIDIAVSAGYENQESYTRAFRKSFDMTPSAYRRIGRRAMFLKKVEIDEDYIRHLQTNVTLEPTINIQPERRLVGIRTKFFSVDSEKNNIAQKLPILWKCFLERLAEIPNTVDGLCYGALYRVDEDNEQLNYMAGIEVRDAIPIPDGMETIVLPECCYAQFTHRGKVAQLDNTVNYIYSNWLLKSGHKHTYGPDLELYGTNYHPTSKDSIILDKSVKTRKSMQALDAPSKIKKNLITNKVTATFLISLCTSIAYMSFPRLTDLSRIIQYAIPIVRSN